MVREIRSTADRIFVNLDFYPFYQKIKIVKNEKIPGDIIILHMFNKNDIHMMYGSWDMVHDREPFVFLDLFLPFYLTNNLKNQNFLKMKQVLGDIVILHKCTKNHDHMPYCPWNMECGGGNFYFSFWAIFSTFTPLTFQKIKIF